MGKIDKEKGPEWVKVSQSDFKNIHKSDKIVRPLEEEIKAVAAEKACSDDFSVEWPSLSSPEFEENETAIRKNGDKKKDAKDSSSNNEKVLMENKQKTKEVTVKEIPTSDSLKYADLPKKMCVDGGVQITGRRPVPKEKKVINPPADNSQAPKIPKAEKTPPDTSAAKEKVPGIEDVNTATVYFVFAMLSLCVLLMLLGSKLALPDYIALAALGVAIILSINVSFSKIMVLSIIIMGGYFGVMIYHYFFMGGEFIPLQIGWFITTPLCLVTASNMTGKIKQLIKAYKNKL